MRPVLSAALFGLYVSCASTPPIEPPRPTHPLLAATISQDEPAKATSLVLVTIDGSRWQEIFTGTDEALAAQAHVRAKTPAELVPTLSRWMTSDGLAIGAPGHGEMRATGPNYVSLPGYAEILSGRAPTRCQSNECAAAIEPTFIDDAIAAFPRDAVAVISSWESIRRVASTQAERLVWSTGRSDAHDVPDAWLAAGRARAPWPGQGDYRPDDETAKLALRVIEEMRPRVTFVGFGDTDEHAHHGDYARYLDALTRADAFLEQLERALEESGEAARTTIIVTCDHGRNAAFREHGGAWLESGRVWLIARGAGVARAGLVDLAHGARLSDIAPTARVLLGMRPDDDVRAGRPIVEMLR